MVANVYQMEQQCLWSSVICTHLASKFLSENGCLVLTGASVALGPTPGRLMEISEIPYQILLGMLGYGMVKAAVHQLTKSLAEDHTLPTGTWVGAILP